MTTASSSGDELVARALELLLNGDGEPGHGLEAVCSLVCEAGLADIVQVFVTDADDVHLRCIAVAGLDSDHVERLRSALHGSVVRIDSSVSGRAATGREPIVDDDFRPVGSTTVPEEFLPFVDRHDHSRLVAIPVPWSERPLGALVATRDVPAAAYSTDEVALLARVAALSAFALERASLLRRVARQADVLDLVDDAILAVDENMVVTKWNAGAERLYGISRADAVGTPLPELLTVVSHEAAVMDQAWTDIRSSHGWREQVRQVTRDGRVVEVEAHVSPIRSGDTGFGGAVAVNRDVSARLRAQRDLEERQAFAEAVLDALPGRTMVVGVDGTVRAVNARYQAEGPFGDGPGSGPDVGADALSFVTLLANSRPGMGVLAHALRAAIAGRDGDTAVDIPGASETWTSAQVMVFRGSGAGALVTFSDVTDRKAHELELAHRATHDPLTELPNRALLLDRLREALARAFRGGHQVGVLYVDLDELKAVNDSLGHAAGDDVIRDAAVRLSESCRITDTVARVGGDEFVMILDELHDIAEAEILAGRVLEALRAPRPYSDQVPHLRASASIGVAVARGMAMPDDSDAQDLVRHADVAMLLAKRRGKDRIVLQAP